MKYQLITSSRFKKSFKKLKSNKDFNKKEFDKVIRILSEGNKLDSKYKNHKLNGEYFGYDECHVQNDMLLIYKYVEKELVLYAVDIGTHSDLF